MPPSDLDPAAAPVRARAPVRVARYEDEWWLALLAEVLSSVVSVAAALQGRVERSTLGRPHEPDRVPLVVDAAIAATVKAAAVAVATTRTIAQATRPVTALLLEPPLLPRRLHPQTRLQEMAQRGRRIRTQATVQAVQLGEEVLPTVVDAVLDRMDLTGMVLRHLEMSRVLDAVDVNQVANRLELDPIIDRVPIDRILDRVDVNEIVAKVDVESIVDRVDVEGVVAKVDVDAIVNRLDLDAIAARLDVAAVIDRLDLSAIATQVITEIDLPEIIRESSGAMASEAVRGVRMQGIEADERMNRIIDKILLRRRAAKTNPPTTPDDNVSNERDHEPAG